MLAESIHSVADTGNQALLLLGGRAGPSGRATPTHPFGYGRERYFWSFVVALVLFTLGSLFAIFEGVEKIRHPHELESLGWAIGILAVGHRPRGPRSARPSHESLPTRATHRGGRSSGAAKQPELPVVLLEDLGALLGLRSPSSP